MNSYTETRRQIRTALIVFLVVLVVGISGFMLIERMSLLDAVWLTIVTLATVGYGDIVPQTELGRLFTIVMLLTGLGVFAFAVQAFLTLLFSPDLIRFRQQARTTRLVAKLRQHFIIIGQGDLVDHAVESLVKRANIRRAVQARRMVQRFGRRLPPRAQQFIYKTTLKLSRQITVADLVVCVTQDPTCASDIRAMGILAIEGDPNDDETLARAGITEAQALMVMEDSDTDTLLTVLTANVCNPNLMITAAVQDSRLAHKLMRAGANHLIDPADVAAQFLNNVTFRPAVNEFFSSILFEQETEGWHVLQVFMYDDSPWIGRPVSDLDLHGRFDGAGLLAVRRADGSYAYYFTPDDVFEEDEVVLVIAPEDAIPAILRDSRPGQTYRAYGNTWQRLVTLEPQTRADSPMTAERAAQSVAQLRNHFIIGAGGQVAASALDRLAPERPFVVITADPVEAAALLGRGFRVVEGNLTDESTLKRAGIERALAIMVATDDRAANVMAVLTCRTLNKHILITSVAEADEMVAKLQRAGADRVINPARIASQFLLLATTRPVISDFMNYVLYNRATGVETTELYIEDGSPWAGRSIASLQVWRDYDARIIGVRRSDTAMTYSPAESYIIQPGDVVIAITTMQKSDPLRDFAYGEAQRRPQTLRTPLGAARPRQARL